MQTEETKAFNRPHQCTVAIDTRHIGDDNDYSCFLSSAVYQLYLAGQIDVAYRLQRTDPMLISDLTLEEFKERMEQQTAFYVEHQKTKDLYDRLYND